MTATPRYPDTWNSRAGENRCGIGDPCDACLEEAKAAKKADPDQFLRKAKEVVIETAPELTSDDLFIVWFAKTLGNWKALLSTDYVDGVYWEVTYNGAKQETYVDTYHKRDNVAIKDAL